MKNISYPHAIIAVALVAGVVSTALVAPAQLAAVVSGLGVAIAAILKLTKPDGDA